MASQFITGNELNHELGQLFEDADSYLLLISPFIKLHERYASVLRSKLESDKLAITLVFGKNAEDPSRSMGREDLEFFIQFPNIEIRYEPRLHAKYYANDRAGIITSMNLYRYSHDHNIEAGVKMERASMHGELANRMLGRMDVEEETFAYFDRVIEQAELLYRKVPTYEKTMLGLAKKYLSTEVTNDRVAEFFAKEGTRSTGTKVQHPRAAPQPTPSRNAHVSTFAGTPGYCIRTGSPIAFNVKKPLSDAAYQSWSRYKDENYKEKFCHFTGEGSNGETSVARPILRKNWSQAKNTFNF